MPQNISVVVMAAQNPHRKSTYLQSINQKKEGIATSA
jgi:hypothetical protein